MNVRYSMVRKICLSIFFISMFSAPLFAFNFEDDHALASALNLGTKIPVAFGACGTLIHPEYVLTHVDVGDIKKVKIKDTHYSVVRRTVGPNSGKLNHNKLQVLRLANPVDIPHVQVFLDPQGDFVLKGVQSLVAQGTFSFHVGPAPSVDVDGGICKNLEVLDFDLPRVVVALPVKAISVMAIGQSGRFENESRLGEIIIDPSLADKPQNMPLTKQRSLFSNFLNLEIPTSINAGPFTNTGGAIFMVLGKKNDAPFDAEDLVVFGVRGNYISSGMESLIEATTWIKEIFDKDNAGPKKFLSPMRNVQKQYAGVVADQAFALGANFSGARKLAKSCTKASDFGTRFEDHYDVSHFDLCKQPMRSQLSESDASEFNDCAPKLEFHRQNEDLIAAVLTINTFDSKNSAGSLRCYDRKSVRRLLKKAEKKGAPRLIVDLRENYGGAVKNSNHFVRVLVGADVEGFDIYKSTYNKARKALPKKLPKDARKLTSEHYAILARHLDAANKAKRGKQLFTGKIKVLISDNTTSAAESVALALYEHLGAELFGQKTAGSVLVSDTTPICYGYCVQKPVADFISRKGTRIEGVGVKPTRKLPKKTDALQFVLEQYRGQGGTNTEPPARTGPWKRMKRPLKSTGRFLARRDT